MKRKILLVLYLLLLLSGCAEDQAFSMDTSSFTNYANISSESVWDLCPFMDTQLNYMLLTREELEPEDAVMMCLTNFCEYESEPCTESWMTEFPFWLYQTYRGMDWNKVAEVSAAAQTGDKAAQKKLAEYQSLYREDYEALSPDELPQLFGYWIRNNVTSSEYNYGRTAAQYEHLQLEIIGEVSSVDVGLLNVYRQGMDQYLNSAEIDEDLYAGRIADARPVYWGDGIVTLDAMIIQEEPYPQILKRLELHGIVGEVMEIRLMVGETELEWDGASDVEIPAFTKAEIVVKLQTQANQVVGYCEDANFMLQRMINGHIQRLWYFASISQSWNIYELYAMMIDGLDVGAYYAYSEGWKEPEPTPVSQPHRIDFELVTVADTADYSLYATGASWDGHAYSIHFSASNKTTDSLELAVENVFLNNWIFGVPYAIHLEPNESGDFTWRIAWEAMEEFGIPAKSGEDIQSVEFILNVLYNGKVPVDESGIPIINETFSCIYPLGEEAVHTEHSPGTLIFEKDDVRLYAVHVDHKQYSKATKVERPLCYTFSYVVENIGADSAGYEIFNICIDGIPVSDMGCSVIRSGGRLYNEILLNVSKDELTSIAEPETISFSFVPRSADTYEIIINLADIMEG